MRRGVGRVAGVGMGIALTFGCGTTAMALWMASGATQAAPMPLGAVSMGASGLGDAKVTYSPDGSPVTVVLPGSVVVGVLGQTGIDPAPVMWRFTVDGYAQGIAGLDVDVSVVSQVSKDGTVTDLSKGVADDSTLLSFSTMKVYPASVSGDCSAVPATPDPAPDENVLLYDNTDHALQAPGAFSGAPVTQVWCVAIDFNNQPDAAYVNQVQAIGTANDGTPHAAMDIWNAVVAFPPSLDPMGMYINRADVAAVAVDGSIARDSATYRAMIYPDPGEEPGVTILLAPTVTSLNPPGP